MTMTAEVVAMTDVQGAKVLEVGGGWHVVTHGGVQVSVAPDGLVHPPGHHHRPEDSEDFIGALLAAAELGAKIVADRPVDVIPPVVARPVGPAASLPRGFTAEALAAARARRSPT